MKFTVFSDLHINDYKSYSVNHSRLYDTLNCLEFIIEKSIETYSVDFLLFCGDFFDTPKTLAHLVINETMKRLAYLFKKYPDCMIYAISGNHDYASQQTIDRDAVTSLSFLSYAFPKNFILIDSNQVRIPYSDGNRYLLISGVQYYNYAQDYYNRLNIVASSRMSSDAYHILITHATLTGFGNNFGEIDHTHDVFNLFDYTFSGDVHEYKQLTSKLVMVGNPLHRDAGDCGKSKGFIFCDLDEELNTLCNHFIDITSFFPRFFIKKIYDPLPLDFTDKDFIKEIDDVYDNVDFHTDLSQKFNNTNQTPAELLSTWFNEVFPSELDKLSVGLNILNKIS